MNYNLIIWIYFLILQSFTASSLPIPNQYDLGVIGLDHEPRNISPRTSKYEDSVDSSEEKVISVRITSSVAVGRGRGKPTYRYNGDTIDRDLKNAPSTQSASDLQPSAIISKVEELIETGATDVPPNLVGANIEYIKQLNAKKEFREYNADPAHPFELKDKGQNDGDDETSTKIYEYEDIHDIPLARKVSSTADANRFQDYKSEYKFQNTEVSLPFEANNNDKVNSVTASPTVDQQTDKETRNIDRLKRIDETIASNSKNYQTDDSVAEPSIKSIGFAKYNEKIENIPPTATMPSVRSSNIIQGLTNRPQNEERNNPRLTTVSFNIVHDNPKLSNDNEPSTSYISASQIIPNQKQFYEAPKIYSEPAKIYSEPSKFYSEPAKIYSEPAKIYSEPAKVYSEPAKIYSEPSKFYSEPASLHLEQNVPSSIPPTYMPWQRLQRPFGSTTVNTTPISTVTNVFQQESTIEHQPEKNYEVDEKISVLTDGRSHGVQQDTTTEKCKQDNCKVGYVLEGRQFKKYRVEERTPDGFIVGEYGVVRNEDGALRGVRYTADGDASPRLIHDALMKFLQLT